ncbi:FAD-dependent monooxygenase [Nonomuraea roseoviolacea]|uniref:2-polyprenyl-6-methoxyphenol hydroxylase-like FAD-dependent oxidoreductase n=1 Tax=Nonomuraea roseoviolacea subsp. carminata TaxID=160689 RepID=A0ABT1JX84_9ACTN|nr:FAD-dependent monooxygenase [Nonomuraea roseoviolacea]MCP2346373.1 2-polyprenyl-6-methoxyphenol hydroxylase-like FAD-dependent oxidoreductase [Nonomuraea roseoviolacea subsp. carminata]
MSSVLVSGAGIGGPVLAYWLARHGFDVTIVERATAPRRGGQAVDLRGAAVTVAERMGVLEQVLARRTHMLGMSMVDRDGNEIMRTTERTVSAGRLDGDDVEIMREDLVAIVTAAAGDAETIHGDSIATLEQDAGGVDVTFERGDRRRFDYVVGADGLHSNVRALAFGEESRFVRHLGMYVSIFSAPNFLDLDRWQIWYREGDAGYGVYSAPGNATIRVNAGFGAGPLAYDHRDVEAQKRMIEEHCSALGWETPRLMKAMWEAEDFYFDAMAQVHMDRWSAGRVTLLGDAGYCASPLSGQGTSLAMVGAYVLADELGADPRGAFDRYEERMREFVRLNQELATENPGEAASDESVRRAATAVSLDR